MTVCHPSPSGISGRFIGTTSAASGSGSNGGGSGDGSTFLLCTFGTGVQVTTSDLDLLHRL